MTLCKCKRKKRRYIHDVFEWLIEAGRCYGMKTKVQNKKDNETLQATIPSTDHGKPKINCRMWNIPNIWVASLLLMQYVNVALTVYLLTWRIW